MGEKVDVRTADKRDVIMQFCKFLMDTGYHIVRERRTVSERTLVAGDHRELTNRFLNIEED